MYLTSQFHPDVCIIHNHTRLPRYFSSKKKYIKKVVTDGRKKLPDEDFLIALWLVARFLFTPLRDSFACTIGVVKLGVDQKKAVILDSAQLQLTLFLFIDIGPTKKLNNIHICVLSQVNGYHYQRCYVTIDFKIKELKKKLCFK